MLANELYKTTEGVSLDRIRHKNHGFFKRCFPIKNYVKELAYSALIALVLVGGCGNVEVARYGNPGENIKFVVGGKPRFRMGSYASSTLGTKFPDPEDLGSHGYGFSLSEKKRHSIYLQSRAY